MLRSSLIYLVGRYGASAITLLAIAAYTRLVTPAEYGIYSLSFTAATLLYSTCLFWLRDALIRFMPLYAERERLLISQVAAGYVAVAAVSLLLLLAFSFAPEQVPFVHHDTTNCPVGVPTRLLIVTYGCTVPP
jgi:O-antigen/teichoic acid export membrane protein